MSTLLVDELFDGVSFQQKIRIDRPVYIAHIRPWIYKHNDLVDGFFTCEVWQGSQLLSTSQIPHGEINGQIQSDFAHGYIRFDFSPGVQLHVEDGQAKTEYTLKFYMDGHTSNSNAFIGIVREWDGEKYAIYGDLDGSQPINDSISPAGIEIYEFRSI